MKTKKTENLHSYQLNLQVKEYLNKLKNVFKKKQLNQKMPDLMTPKLILGRMKKIFNSDKIKIKILGAETFEIETRI